ncbi:GAL4-like Zn(II)2Cys6 (or C6 zinc) binuclear cluster DNA-binding domain [Teratosphaeria destructans]|uniref:GAL4-like Zn(II)2Cys6 (Or C6 zinc) binuclear cluster DNA-binding domain n=1 Tax=Teratosphaeria destructans TaxID=418781 RepID=A0A9W7SK44_9PEZI|nr:GAL4-like Zn(II)2Cys6 (or C6 zinc) binuclear cluster DNA-binding domain [Teratosphaeria destructans]
MDPTWWPKDSSSVPEPEILGYVIHLCKTIPFFCEPVTSNAGHIGIFLPMRTAAIYFTQHNHWREAKWVGAVRKSVFTKGLSPPQVRDPPGALSKMHRLPGWDRSQRMGNYRFSNAMVRRRSLET